MCKYARGGMPLVGMAICVLLLAGLATAPAAQARNTPQQPAWERCVFEVPATTYDEAHDWIEKIRNAGAIITVVASPRMYLGRVTSEEASRVRSLGASVHYSGDLAFRASSGSPLTPEERAVINVCGERAIDHAAVPAFSSRTDPSGLGQWTLDDEFEIAETPMVAGSRPLAVSSAADSTFDGFTPDAVGDIAVGLILFESDGTIDSNWFDWDSEEIDTVTTRVTDVLDNYAEVALQYAQHVTWHLLAFNPTDSVMQVPWQQHLHMGPYGAGLNFALDTLPARIYDNFGIDTVESMAFGIQGTAGPRAFEMNKIIADSVNADMAIHHFVMHATTLCDYSYGSGKGGVATARGGKCAFYSCRRSEPDPYDSCISYWHPDRHVIAHEGLHVFCTGDEYGTTCSSSRFADFTTPQGYKLRNSDGFNAYACPIPNFRFPCIMQGQPGYVWSDVCPATAREAGWLGSDYGDAPSPFPTLKSDNGARHLTSGFEWLGKSVGSDELGSISFENDADSVDAEFIDWDGQSNLDASGGDDSDDGVFFTCTLNENALDTVEVILSNHGIGSYRYFVSDTAKIYLNAWADWNGDKDWDDAGEHFIDSYAWIPADTMVLSDTVIFTFTPPEGYADTIWARFRLDYGEDCGTYTTLFSDSTLDGPEGSAVWGEVEDYLIVNGLEVNWMRGDLDGDHEITSLDLTIMINHLCAGGPPAVPWEASDLDCDGFITALDQAILIEVLYAGGDIPCSP